MYIMNDIMTMLEECVVKPGRRNSKSGKGGYFRGKRKYKDCGMNFVKSDARNNKKSWQ